MLVGAVRVGTDPFEPTGVGVHLGDRVADLDALAQQGSHPLVRLERSSLLDADRLQHAELVRGERTSGLVLDDLGESLVEADITHMGRAQVLLGERHVGGVGVGAGGQRVDAEVRAVPVQCALTLARVGDEGAGHDPVLVGRGSEHIVVIGELAPIVVVDQQERPALAPVGPGVADVGDVAHPPVVNHPRMLGGVSTTTGPCSTFTHAEQ